MMFWKVLVPLCLLCLSGLAYGDKDPKHTGDSKRKSEDKGDKDKTVEAATESTPLEISTEAQTQSVIAETVAEELVEKKKDKPKNQTQKLDKEPSTRSSPKVNSLVGSRQQENIFLYLFRRNQPVEVVTADSWFENFAPSKDLVILVHGAFNDPNYIEDYFNTLAYALLNESNYNVIGVNWKHLMVPETKKGHLEANTVVLKYLGITLSTLFKNKLPEFFDDNLNTYYIGHDLGTIPPISFLQASKKPFKYVYGLDPRRDLPQSGYRLEQEHGGVVAILCTYNYPYSYGHKNIYAVSVRGSSSPAYKVLAKAIVSGRTTATFCPDVDYFSNGYCSMLPQVPVWFMHSPTEILSKSNPIGRYYFYESPSNHPRCSGTH